MNFKQFKNSLAEALCGTHIEKEYVFHSHVISLAKNGGIFVNYRETEFKSLQEAKDHISTSLLEHSLLKDMYEDVPSRKIASIISKYHNVRVTDTLIESYVDLASSKSFTLDQTCMAIRNLNPKNNLIDNKFDFILDDNSKVAISENTHFKLRDLIGDKYQLVEYMRKNKRNFMHVLKKLI